MRRIPVDVDVAIGKMRSAIPHWYEMEAIARRGFLNDLYPMMGYNEV
jgi:hypothetical protein